MLTGLGENLLKFSITLTVTDCSWWNSAQFFIVFAGLCGDFLLNLYLYSRVLAVLHIVSFILTGLGGILLNFSLYTSPGGVLVKKFLYSRLLSCST